MIGLACPIWAILIAAIWLASDLVAVVKLGLMIERGRAWFFRLGKAHHSRSSG